MGVIVNEGKCTGCGTCEEMCPSDAIKVVDDKAKVDNEACIDCGTCVDESPEEALSMEE